LRKADLCRTKVYKRKGRRFQEGGRKRLVGLRGCLANGRRIRERKEHLEKRPVAFSKKRETALVPGKGEKGADSRKKQG